MSTLRHRLSDDQQTVFDAVATSLERRYVKPLYVSGSAGVGKSFLIDALAHHVYSTLGKDSLLITSLTGLAAFNVRGTTVHSGLGLHPFEKKRKPSEEVAKRIASIRLLIVDECSLLSCELLESVRERLMTFNRGRGPFGRVLTVFIGDFFQLPAVRAAPIFTDKILWSQIGYHELKTNHRQREDDDFANLLNRMRTGSPTSEDIAKLFTRVFPAGLSERNIAERFVEKMKTDEKVVALFATNRSVENFNKLVLELLNMRRKLCVAKDAKGRLLPATHPTTVVLAVGARVALRKNVAITQGIVNGALGVVRNIIEVDGVVEAIVVAFDGKGEPISIGRHKYEKVMAFPLAVAFAVSIHRAQGLTISTLFVRLAGMFSPGMGYTALGRARRLQDVYILALDQTAFKADARVHLEYTRLRTENGDLEPLPPLNQYPTSINRIPEKI